MNRCVIIAGGDCEISCLRGSISEGDYIIAADSGYSYCAKAGIIPDLIVGDFDSYAGDIPQNTDVIKLPTHKDDTDLMFAVRCGIDKGFEDFVIFGGYGSRPDQNFAMFQTLLWIKQQNYKAKCQAVCSGFEVHLLRNETMRFKSDNNRYLSVFAFGGEASGVTIENAEYPLNNAKLSPMFPLGVSNSSDGDCTVSVNNGNLLVMLVNKDI